MQFLESLRLFSFWLFQIPAIQNRTLKMGHSSTRLGIHQMLFFPDVFSRATLPSSHQLLFQGSNASLAPRVCNYHHHYRQLDHTAQSSYRFSRNKRQKEWVTQTLRGASLEPDALRVGQIVLQTVGEVETGMCVGESCCWE